MRDLSSIDAVVLAGGKGTRIAAALPDGCPKVLAEVGGRPLLAHLLDQLYQRGIRRITLCLGYGAAQIQEFLASAKPPQDLRIECSIEREPAGTGGALREAMPHIRSDPFFALNGDTCSDVDLEDLLASHRRGNAEITVALAQVSDVAGFGEVEMGLDGRIRRFGEKVRAGGAGLVNAGTYAIRKAVLSALPGGFVSWETGVLPRYIGRGLHGHACCSWFVDIGTPESLRRAAQFLPQPAGAAR